MTLTEHQVPAAEHGSDRRSFLRTAGGVAALASVGGLGSLTLGASPAAAASNGFGLTITDQAVFGGRMHYFRFATNQIGWQPAVNVLLPDDYFSTSWRRYPVMYLFHGGLGDFRTFDMNDDIRTSTSSSPGSTPTSAPTPNTTAEPCRASRWAVSVPSSTPPSTTATSPR